MKNMTLCALAVLLAAGPSAAQDDSREKIVTNSIGMKLAFIPAGTFRMGSPAGEAERDDEELQHDVTITKPFYMGVTEVTQAQFQKIMKGVLKANRYRSGGPNPSQFKESRGGGPDHPVEQGRWSEVVKFCEVLSALPEEKSAGRTYRLPTEAEWEYASRAGTKTVFHFGNSLSSRQANFNGAFPYGGGEKGPYLRKTCPVATGKPNAWGLYDMHGNVWEWCSDYYDKDYYRRSPKEDPKGPEKGVIPTGFGSRYFRVARGGCWLDEARACRSAYRFRFMPDVRHRLVGFRVVCETGGAR